MKTRILMVIFMFVMGKSLACDWNYHVSIWSMIESGEQINSNDVEWSESVNEYIYCELQDNCNSFLIALSKQSPKVEDYILSQLAHPISDTYPIRDIIDNVVKADVDDELKKRLLNILYIHRPIRQNQNTPEEYQDKYQEAVNYMRRHNIPLPGEQTK